MKKILNTKERMRGAGTVLSSVWHSVVIKVCLFSCKLSSGEHIGCPFATQEESGFEDELPAFSFLSFDPIMVAEQFTLMDAVSMFPFPVSSKHPFFN